MQISLAIGVIMLGKLEEQLPRQLNIPSPSITHLKPSMGKPE